MTIRIPRLRWVASVPRLFLPALFIGASVRAQVVPIPIDRPTVISESGSYVVTRDFSAVTGPAIRLLGDIAIDIDFAGHTVGGEIRLREPFSNEPGCPWVTLHDGRMVGWIDLPSARGSCEGRTVRVDIVNMIFEGGGWLEDGDLSVTSSRLIGGFAVDANYGWPSARFEDNVIIGVEGSIYLLGANMMIRRNVMHGTSINVSSSDGWGSFGDIEDNKLIDGSIWIERYWGGNYAINFDVNIKRNVVAGTISVGNCDSCWIVENHVKGCGPSGSGVTVDKNAYYGRVEGNVVTGACPFGIRFDDTTKGNLYRDNVLPRATCAPVRDEGTDNFDGGGNKAPNRSVADCPVVE